VKVILVLALTFFSISPQAQRSDVIRANIAYMPGLAEVDVSGPVVDMVKAWQQVSGKHFDIRVYPFKRSLSDVEQKNADFHYPLFKGPLDTDNANYFYSNSVLIYVNFVAYVRKGSNIRFDDLANVNVSTEGAHTHLFEFPVDAEFSIDGALRKVLAGRSDVFIFADVITDRVLVSLELSGIERRFYKRFPIHAILPQSQRGREVDVQITEWLNAVLESGQYEKIFGPKEREFDPWQPDE
jgi:polar amino acid transport system substrate-binding protein